MITEMERLVRCIIAPRVFPSQRWHVVQNKKFPQRLSKIQKRGMQRQRAMIKGSSLMNLIKHFLKRP